MHANSSLRPHDERRLKRQRRENLAVVAGTHSRAWLVLVTVNEAMYDIVLSQAALDFYSVSGDV